MEDGKDHRLQSKSTETDVQFGLLNSILIDIKLETGFNYLLYNQIVTLQLQLTKFSSNKFNYLLLQ